VGGSFAVWLDTRPEHTRFHWSEGNMSCDCNRVRFLPAGGVYYHELWDGPVGSLEGLRCGCDILVDIVEPLDCPEASPLLLNESS